MSTARKVVIAGGTGLIGRALVGQFVAEGWLPVILSRSANPNALHKHVVWDAKTAGDWVAELEGAEAVVNLTGESIAQKWTLANQQRIRDSRIDATHVIGNAIGQCKQPPKRWINASAVGYYGHTGDETVDESSEAGPDHDFLATTCKAWEQALWDSPTPNTHKCALRVGVALSAEGGILKVLIALTKAFLGGPVGSGRQYVPWIHIRDLSRLFTACASKDSAKILLGVAPQTVTNREFMADLRELLGRPWAPPAPAFGVQLASLFGAPDPALILEGARAYPKAALDDGFSFEFPHLRAALKDLLADSR